MLSALRSALLLDELRRNLRLRRDDLEEIQRKKLRALIEHAYRNVPYYRKLFDAAGVLPERIRGVEDLCRIPTTSKKAFQASGLEERMARGLDMRRCTGDVTSGSTGIPLRVYFTTEDYSIRSLIFIRTFMEAGYSLTDRQAIVCDTRFVSERKYWFQSLGLFRKTYIPVQLGLDQQIALLRGCSARLIHGYARSLGLIASEILRRGIADVRPRAVCTGAELLGDRTRRAINAAFDVDLLDTYATIESGLIAWECAQHKGYHINSDAVVVELLHEGRPALPGEPGRVLVTNLHSYAMPIIRYEVGDVCTQSGACCPCGSAFPLMSIVEGRIDDLICTPSGKVVSPNSITNVLEAVEGISEFRVIQKRKEALLVELVEGRGFNSDVLQAVKRLLGELVGDDVVVEIEMVESIPKAHTGKIRAVISEVGSERQLSN